MDMSSAVALAALLLDALVVLGGGFWAVQKVHVGVSQLNATMRHLDHAVNRLEESVSRLDHRTDRLETRVTVLETVGRLHEPVPAPASEDEREASRSDGGNQR